VNIENSISETLFFSEKHDDLRLICSGLDERREAEVEKGRQRLNDSGIRPDHPSYTRIRTALDASDVLTANEYIDMVLHDLPLPEMIGGLTHSKGFSLRPPGNTRFHGITSHAPARIIKEIRQNKGRGGPIDMRRVTGYQRTQAGEMLEAWFTLKQNQRLLDTGRIRQILTNFGFTVVQVKIAKSGPRPWIQATTEVIRIGIAVLLRLTVRVPMASIISFACGTGSPKMNS
jgi:hypothetical protein